MSVRLLRMARTAAWICVPAFLFAMIIRQYFTRERPSLPNPAIGRTIAVLVNYGKTVFVTSVERNILYASYIALALAVASTLILYVLSKAK